MLFDKTWFESDARKWLKENGFKSSKVDITKNKLRFRQFTPGDGRFRTKRIGDGIEFVLEFR